MKKLIPILLAVFALASCEKDPDMGKLDDNYLVYTNYDKKADFKVPTFYLAPQCRSWYPSELHRKYLLFHQLHTT